MIGIESVRPLATLTARGNWNTTCVAASVASIWSAAAATGGGGAIAIAVRRRRAPAAVAVGAGDGGGGGAAAFKRSLGVDAAAIDAGHQAARDLDRHFRPRDVVGLVERLAEGDGTAGDQRQLDLLPVLAAQILDRRPALQRRARGRGSAARVRR